MDRERHRRRMVASMRNGRMWEAVKGRLGLSRRRLSRRDRGERGAVLIEAIIVIPLLMMITLGVIEYGGAYREDSTVAAASRAGARVASALSKTDFGVTNAQTDSGVVTAQAVASVLQSLGSTAPQQMWIYRVEPSNTSCGPPTFSSCTYKIGYQWNPATKSFGTSTISGSTAWPLTAQSACAGGTIDQIGVWITINHTAVTHMFGTGRALTGQTIMRLEPNVSNSCAAS
jgi:Flp pilus assembly protein TadG